MAKVSKEERLLKIKALQDELKILNEDNEAPEPQPEIKEADASEQNEDSEAIQKPKKKEATDRETN
jgi:hypothetical protein